MVKDDMQGSAPDRPIEMRRLILILFAIAAAMVSAGIGADVYLTVAGQDVTFFNVLRNLFYPDAEMNMFVWYSALVLAGIGIGFLVLAAVTRVRRSRLAFIALAAIGFLLSADETVML